MLLDLCVGNPILAFAAWDRAVFLLDFFSAFFCRWPLTKSYGFGWLGRFRSVCFCSCHFFTVSLLRFCSRCGAGFLLELLLFQYFLKFIRVGICSGTHVRRAWWFDRLGGMH